VDAAHVLIPVKRLTEAKSRLSAVLSGKEREELMLEMLLRVVPAVEEAGVGPVTIVSSREAWPASVAVYDDRGLAWNEALSAAIRDLVSEPIATVIAADVPLVTADDVRALVEATPDRGLAIARARDGGTNAVSMRPPGVVETHFGEPQSAAVHAQATAAAGLAARIVDLPGLAFDVDTPADLEELRAACR
jgi:2-phospho-L-lactate/phosphoenolpyruvate guanylyltransferase